MGAAREYPHRPARGHNSGRPSRRYSRNHIWLTVLLSRWDTSHGVLARSRSVVEKPQDHREADIRS